MTKRELDALGATCLGALSRCTPDGIEKLKRYHDGTIQLLRWYRQNMVTIGPAAASSLTLLLSAVRELESDPRLCRPASERPTLDWMEVPL